MSTWSRTFPAKPESIRAARGFVRDTLSPRTTRDALDRAVLVVSELATNAVMHVGGDYEVQIHSDGTVRVCVQDQDPSPPVVQHPSVDEPAGRGLAIVQAVCNRWGVSVDEGGKTIWCELPAKPRLVS